MMLLVFQREAGFISSIDARAPSKVAHYLMLDALKMPQKAEFDDDGPVCGPD
jgi:hypothetical protein